WIHDAPLPARRDSPARRGHVDRRRQSQPAVARRRVRRRDGVTAGVRAGRPARASRVMPVTAEIEATLRELLAMRSPASYERATTLALESYGPELVGWLCASMPESDAHDAFGMLAEELWKSLPDFDGRCSVRTWCYMLARAARFRTFSSAARR